MTRRLRSNPLADHEDPRIREFATQVTEAQTQPLYIGERFRIEELIDKVGLKTSQPGGRYLAFRFQDSTGRWLTLATLDQVTGDLDIFGSLCGGIFTPQSFRLKPYVVGERVIPTTANGHRYKCTTAGTSGASEPTWPTDHLATVADGTVTWTEDGTVVGVDFESIGRNPGL